MLKNHFSLFLALRYLKPKRTFLSIITLISILGVTLGICQHGYEPTGVGHAARGCETIRQRGPVNANL